MGFPIAWQGVRVQAADTPPGRSTTIAASMKSESEFWKTAVLFRDSIVAKVRDLPGRAHLVEKLAGCQTERSWLVCESCSEARQVWNHCDLKFCPLCTPRLAAMRRESISEWTKKVRQPKHVVLTMRNEDTLTRRYIRSGQAAVSKLRRSVFAAQWQGGLVATELTNEGRGWHLHYHCLIDARWIHSSALAQKWARLVGQDFAIVKVKDCRDKSYLQEVTKYAVKGSELASWSAEDIVKFILAFRGVRTFQVFGSLFKERAAHTAFLKEVRTSRREPCACGCKSYRFQLATDDGSVVMPTRDQLRARTRARLGLDVPSSHLL